MQATRTYPKRKIQMYDDLLELVKKHKVIALIKMEKVRSTQLMQVRKKFRGQLKIIMVKNNIAKKVLEKVDIKGIDKVIEALDGLCAIMFTDRDPFKICIDLDKSKIYLPAKKGDIATDEIVIPEGNTGIPPGPVLSEFKEVKVATKIDSGSIAVSEDTVVAVPGDVISHKLSALLSKLGIKPIQAGMSINMALQEGMLYTSEDLKIDIEEIKQELFVSFNAALALAINASYTTKESMEHLLRKAFGDARSLSINSRHATTETVKDVLHVANGKAQILYETAKKKSGYS